VVGVSLTGANAVGRAGLLNVVRHGSAAVVPAPLEAEYPAMPRNALRAVSGVRWLPQTAIAAYLGRLVTGQQVPRPVVPGRQLIARLVGLTAPGG
jgi:two-component system chemotaxis response regulator CheB